MLKVVNPATEELITELETDDSRSIIEKYNRAMSAQLEWMERPLDDRARIMTNFKDALTAEADTLARTQSEETGKPISQARSEILATTARVQFFIDHFRDVLADDVAVEPAAAEDGRTGEHITYEPLGVVANISAWNYPYFVGSNVFVPAILTGNAVLYKPSEFACLTGMSIAEVMYQSDLPDEIFIPIIGGAFAGQEMLKWPVGGVFFTGSYRTGRAIADIVSRRFTRLQLELGGKDPAYICDDVDPATTAAAVADGAFYNTGQSCCAVERVYVHEKIYDQFVEAFVETVRGFQVGDPLDENTYIGPLSRKEQLMVLKQQVEDARTKGGKILIGGNTMNRRGYYFEPTVVTDVSHDMKIMSEESFGPVIGIQRVSDDREAIRMMNDTPYGLTAGVFTKDPDRAHGILTKINSGTVYWNCCDRVSPRLPWSGRGDSGIGVTLGEEGIRSFVRPKAWHWRLPG
ncbi:MAG: aldehyde dehydrogenase family protein [bacterium]|nr:aldehyde dehydrogenase family protein [bacterium]